MAIEKEKDDKELIRETVRELFKELAPVLQSIDSTKMER